MNPKSVRSISLEKKYSQYTKFRRNPNITKVEPIKCEDLGVRSLGGSLRSDPTVIP